MPSSSIFSNSSFATDGRSPLSRRAGQEILQFLLDDIHDAEPAPKGNGAVRKQRRVMTRNSFGMLRKFDFGKKARSPSETLREPMPFTIRVVMMSISQRFPTSTVSLKKKRKSVPSHGRNRDGMPKTHENVRLRPMSSDTDR